MPSETQLVVFGKIHSLPQYCWRSHRSGQRATTTRHPTDPRSRCPDTRSVTDVLMQKRQGCPSAPEKTTITQDWSCPHFTHTWRTSWSARGIEVAPSHQHFGGISATSA